MDIPLVFKALVLGIVQGLTEFLPISSTGHLILVGQLLDFNDEKGKIFEIVIQFGAVLAVCWEFRRKIAEVVRGLPSDPRQQRFAMNVIVAALPAVVLALIFSQAIKAYLFNPIVVASALILGGLVILWVERRERRRGEAHDARSTGASRIESLDDLRLADAFKVGLAQCLALIPGTSRSGATIIGGLWFGLSRKVATEFSFFLAIPVIFGATVYELYRERARLSADDVSVFAVGFAAAFISAFFCVRWLLRFISTHDFRGFAWYRIVFGGVVLVTAAMRWIVWQG